MVGGALLIVLLSLSSMQFLSGPVYAASSPLFSVTLIVPGGASNPVRQQYAQMITDNMLSVGINAKLVKLDFTSLANRLWFSNPGVAQGATYDQGGYDMGFIGWGFTSPTIDFSNLQSSSFAPGGNNYALYSSPQMDSLIASFYQATDQGTRAAIGKSIQQLAFQDAPYNYIFEPFNVVARNSVWSAWGNSSLFSSVTFPDVQHWSGGSSLTLAEAGAPYNLNPAFTEASNSFYDFYIINAIMGGALQEVDARTQGYIPGIADNITSSQDALTWNVTIKSGVHFQDGVEVTADDFVFTQYALTNGQLSSTSLGDNVGVLGNDVTFTFLNGTARVDDNRNGNPARSGWWKSLSKYTFQFHLASFNPYAKQIYCGFAPLPMHIMEQFPFGTWDSAPFSTLSSTPHSYTWSTGRYGGSGSYSTVGPVGAGPYILQSYSNNVATLTKFSNYWNATGLESLGQFSVDTYKVKWIDSKSDAMSALENGQVNVLDPNYDLSAADAAGLRQAGLSVISAPALGWQEQGFNMKHPVFGTGVNTPLGKKDPSKAAEAARHVRKAISHLIPRNIIVNDLLGGEGYPLAAMMGPGWGEWQNTDLVADDFDIAAAANELMASRIRCSTHDKPSANTSCGRLELDFITINSRLQLRNDDSRRPDNGQCLHDNLGLSGREMDLRHTKRRQDLWLTHKHAGWSRLLDLHASIRHTDNRRHCDCAHVNASILFSCRWLESRRLQTATRYHEPNRRRILDKHLRQI